MEADSHSPATRDKNRSNTTAAGSANGVDLESNSPATGTKVRAHTIAGAGNGVDPEASITLQNVMSIQKQAASSVEDLDNSVSESLAVTIKKPGSESSIRPLSTSDFLTSGGTAHESLRGRSNTDGTLTSGGHRRAWSFGSKRVRRYRERKEAGQVGNESGEDFVDTGGNLVGLNRINRRSVSISWREFERYLKFFEVFAMPTLVLPAPPTPTHPAHPPHVMPHLPHPHHHLFLLHPCPFYYTFHTAPFIHLISSYFAPPSNPLLHPPTYHTSLPHLLLSSGAAT